MINIYFYLVLYFYSCVREKEKVQLSKSEITVSLMVGRKVINLIFIYSFFKKNLSININGPNLKLKL